MLHLNLFNVDRVLLLSLQVAALIEQDGAYLTAIIPNNDQTKRRRLIRTASSTSVCGGRAAAAHRQLPGAHHLAVAHPAALGRHALSLVHGGIGLLMLRSSRAGRAVALDALWLEREAHAAARVHIQREPRAAANNGGLNDLQVSLVPHHPKRPNRRR